MAAGALGSVSNRLRHENGDTHVVICDDVFSDAGSTPAASTIRLILRLPHGNRKTRSWQAIFRSNGALSDSSGAGVEGQVTRRAKSPIEPCSRRWHRRRHALVLYLVVRRQVSLHRRNIRPRASHSAPQRRSGGELHCQPRPGCARVLRSPRESRLCAAPRAASQAMDASQEGSAHSWGPGDTQDSLAVPDSKDGKRAASAAFATSRWSRH